MHEMSIVTSMLSLVQEEMSKHGVTKLITVRVRYGALTNIVPEALSFAFEALTEGTDLQGARLETELVPLQLRCAQCSAVFEPPDRNLFKAVCPTCACDAGHEVVGGRELYLQHLEAE